MANGNPYTANTPQFELFNSMQLLNQRAAGLLQQAQLLQTQVANLQQQAQAFQAEAALWQQALNTLGPTG